MKTFVTAVILSLAILFATGRGASAANVFEEQGCRFVIDLPDGWDLMPQKNETEYVFKGNGPEMIVIEYLYKESDVSALFKKAVSSFRQAGVPDAEPDGKIQDMKVNDHSGRWAWYEGRYTGADKGTMKAALGAVVLQDGGAIFVFLPGDVSGGTPAKVIKGSFLSLRECRQAATGVDDIRKVDRDAADARGTEPRHELHALLFPLTLPLELPSGWTAKQLDPEFDKDVVSWVLVDGRGTSEDFSGSGLYCLTLRKFEIWRGALELRDIVSCVACVRGCSRGYAWRFAVTGRVTRAARDCPTCADSLTTVMRTLLKLLQRII
jgi:hypothetical protein